jgi:hypothetical protein
MPKIKKQIQKQNLSKIRTWIVDDAPFSDYFRLVQIPEILSGGKNGFLINGSSNLIRSTEVLVELVDVEGNTIFLQPIKNYSEGLARVISIEIYEDTPPGPATLTILGELAFDKNGNRVPDEWIGTYNVKWQKTINVEPTRPNINPIRLYNKPILSVSERLVPFRQTVTGSMLSISTGTIVGQYVPGGVFFIGDDVTNQQRVVITPYTNINVDTPVFVRQSVGGTFTAFINGTSFTSSFSAIDNRFTAKLDNFLTSSDGLPVERWTTSNYTHSYQGPPTYITSSLVRSFAEIKLSQLSTFTGDIQRAKFYVRGADEAQKYEIVEDIFLESNELTVSQSSTGEQIHLGQIVDQPFIDQNWEDGIILNNSYSLLGDVTGTYNSTNLIDSIVLTGTVASTSSMNFSVIPMMWTGIINPILIEANSEYTLNANLLCLKDNSEIEARIDVYLDGPVFSRGYGNQLGLKIAELRSPAGQSRRLFNNFSTNFVSPSSDTARLRFVIYSGEWYISNVQITTSRESGFNPDEVTVLVPIVGRRFERLKFKVDLYDGSSTLIPLNLETDFIYFDGGNFVFRGTDNRIDGLLTVGPSGSGITIGNISSGSFLGIRSGGIAVPISQSFLSSYTGSPLISIYSGTFFSKPQIGLQLIATSGTQNSYLDFNTSDRKLRIRGDIEVLPGTSLSQSIYSGTLTFDELVKLANGVRPSGTFIDGNSIISPNIAGQNGFFSQRFGVGNISSNNGIVLSALGYTSSAGLPISGSPTIYIGAGRHNNSNTPFLVASSSTGPVLSLGNNLNFQPSGSGSELIVRGKVFIEDPVTGQITEFNDVRKVIANRIAFGPFGFYICNL